MGLMKIGVPYDYYNSDYDTYYEELDDLDSLTSYKQTLSDSVEEVVTVTNRLVEMMVSLSGQSIDKLDGEFKDMVTHYEEQRDTIANELNSILIKCTNLRQNLINLESTDYSLQQNWYKIWMKSPGYDEDELDLDDEETFAEYEAMLRLEAACQRSKATADGNINDISSFNDID